MPGDSLLVADAGGTKTAVWLVDLAQPEASRILGRGRSSAGNPLSVGFIEATRAISEAVARAQEDAGRPAAPARRAILSIAGALERDMGKQFSEWARATGLAERVAMVSDVLPVLAAGTPECCGVALISGTGSVAFARSAEGRTALCGGWGYLLGDEGSGYAIGRAVLRLALLDLEEKSEQPLARAARQALGAESVLDVTKAVYRSSDPRGTVAALAPLVIDAAEDGDPAAQAILNSAARDLAAIVARAARSVGLSGDKAIALAVAGGVLVGSDYVRSRLHDELKTLGLDAEIHVVTDPLQGCVRLAAAEFDGTLVEWQ